MRKLWPVITLVIFCLAARWGACEDLADLFNPSREPGIKLGVFWWGAALQGNVGFPTKLNGTGNKINFSDDLGQERAANVPLAKLDIMLSRKWRLQLEYWQVQQEGETILDRTVLFGNQFFTAGEKVASTFTAQVAETIIGYRFFTRAKLDLYVTGGFNVARFDQELRSHTATSKFSMTQVSTLLGLSGDYRLTSRISLCGSLAGYFQSSLNLEEYLVETDWAMAVRFLGGARFVAGYKGYWLSAQDDVSNFRYELSGPYAGLSLAF